MKNRAFAVLSVIAVFLAIPFGHTVVAALREIQLFSVWAMLHFGIGFIGVVSVFLGLKRSELRASVWGFVGGNLMFAGFFEFMFEFMSQVFELKPVLSEKTGNVLVPPSLQVNEASLFILLPLFLLYCIDPQVRCTMILYLRKVLRINVGNVQGSSSTRPYARITASETLFVIWMIYSISVVTLDPRILGPTHWASMVIYTCFLLWPLYLMYRILKIKKAGYAFRYSIPIGVLFWSWVEMLVSMDMIEEFYLHPKEYPMACSLLGIISTMMVVVIYHWPEKTSPV